MRLTSREEVVRVMGHLDRRCPHRANKVSIQGVSIAGTPDRSNDVSDSKCFQPSFWSQRVPEWNVQRTQRCIQLVLWFTKFTSSRT